MSYTIHGIQHLGVGVPQHEEAWRWYRKFFGMDIPLFNDEAGAPLMTIYTDGKVISKRAAMVLNIKGGCAMEVVSPTTFKATHAAVDHQLGDLGIFIGMIKTPDIEKAYDFFESNGATIISSIVQTPSGINTFYIKDLNGLVWQILPANDFYTNHPTMTGGTLGCVIGVSDMSKAINFYSLLGYDEVLSDENGVFKDWENIPGGDKEFRRVLLSQRNPSGGGFSKLAGKSYIELVQDLSERKPIKIYADRLWGDIGFVHLGFDVRDMKSLGEKLKKSGHGFTCDTKDVLSMGESTKVHCTYCEDPDGTLIEMIEVYKIPIIEKLGMYLNVEKRKASQPLPNWMLKALKYTRVKD
jgi:catechol 2,3-dioxygenase-like lactoylglutathione lyase family enzyme